MRKSKPFFKLSAYTKLLHLVRVKMKGGNCMDIYSTNINIETLPEQFDSDFQETIQYQFDFLARKILIRTLKNCRRSTYRKLKRESSFSDIPETELMRLQTIDNYCMDSKYYPILTACVEVKDEAIANALDSLPKQQRDIVLMSYFLEMSDAEIALQLKKNRSNI